MAAISGSSDPHTGTTDRLLSAWQTQATPTALTVGVILATAVALGSLWIGALVAGLFLAGTTMLALEGRTLTVDEFAAISSLHAAAAAVLALSL